MLSNSLINDNFFWSVFLSFNELKVLNKKFNICEKPQHLVVALNFLNCSTFSDDSLTFNTYFQLLLCKYFQVMKKESVLYAD